MWFPTSSLRIRVASYLFTLSQGSLQTHSALLIHTKQQQSNHSHHHSRIEPYDWFGLPVSSVCIHPSTCNIERIQNRHFRPSAFSHRRRGLQNDNQYGFWQFCYIVYLATFNLTSCSDERHLQGLRTSLARRYGETHRFLFDFSTVDLQFLQ